MILKTILYAFVLGAHHTVRGETVAPPTKYGIVLFKGFQSLDVFGPLDVLNTISREKPLELAVLANTLDPVSTNSSATFSESMTVTHTFDNAPKDLEVLIIPGGIGTRTPSNIAPVEEYIKKVFPSLKYVITVCTGSAILAKTGLLDGRKATSNKKSWSWVIAQGPKVNWVPKARWVVDEKPGSVPIWSSSGVSAGIDVTYAFVKHHYGEEYATTIANGLEYERHTDEHYDPFSKIWNVTNS